MHRIESPRNDDSAIEQEIKAKGLTAPRVTPADIEANVACENYFTVGNAVEALGQPIHESHRLQTLCVIVTQSGFCVIGKSACASPENFDEGIGQRIARQDAINQLWPLMGYELKQRLISGI